MIGRRACLLALWLVLLSLNSASPAAPSQGKPRVASVTLCGDDYLLLLADRSQIAGVSTQADDPLAMYPDRARGLPRNRGDVESMLGAKVDIVLMEEGSMPELEIALKRMGAKIVTLPFSEDFSDITKTVQKVADALGQPARGRRVVADMNRRIRQLEADRPPQARRPIALYYRPDGGGAGADTYMNAMLELAGFRNLQVLAGQKGWRGVPLEEAVMNPPQIFITGFFDTQRNSLTATRGKLPVIQNAHVPVVALPGRLMACTSPALLEGAEQAAAARRKYFPAGGAP